VAFTKGFAPGFESQQAEILSCSAWFPMFGASNSMILELIGGVMRLIRIWRASAINGKFIGSVALSESRWQTAISVAYRFIDIATQPEYRRDTCSKFISYQVTTKY
jgi:hypothetical protein